jgi:hypothetical protein
LATFASLGIIAHNYLPLSEALGVQVDWKITLALAGWFFAITQFAFTYRETRNKNESELLEKTLNYFNQGAQARTIGISLVEGIWIKKQKNLDIILPVLVSQVLYLLTEVKDSAQESRNLFRLLSLIEIVLPHANSSTNELAEISEALMWGAQMEEGVGVSGVSLRSWFVKFNNGDTGMWDAEIENS